MDAYALAILGLVADNEPPSPIIPTTNDLALGLLSTVVLVVALALAALLIIAIVRVAGRSRTHSVDRQPVAHDSGSEFGDLEGTRQPVK